MNETSQFRLTGTWELRSIVDINKAGEAVGYPMGERPIGLLIYQRDGHMAVNITTFDATAHVQSMWYAGTWSADETSVTHVIRVAPQQDWIGSRQKRVLEVVSRDHIQLLGAGPRSPHSVRRLEWGRVVSK